MSRPVLLFSALVLGAAAALGASGCPGPDPSYVTVAGAGGLGGGGTTSSSGGAGGSTTSTSTTSTTTTTCDCPELDVLFVQDNSYSITDYTLQLYPVLQQAGPAIQAVVERACSYHVGVVTSLPESNNPTQCRTLGDLSRVNSSGQQCAVQNGIYITEQDIHAQQSFAQLILCLLTSSTQPNGTEKPMAAMFAALDPARNAAGGCNEGFRRPGAPLLIVVISDVDDTLSDVDGTVGPDPPGAWHDLLISMTGGADQVGIAAVIGPSAAQDGGACQAQAPRLHDFVDQFLPTYNAALSICDPDPQAFELGAEGVGQALCPLP